MSKSYNYKVLIKRIDIALENEFYLEASWIAYAILEDRLVSALKESGGAVYNNGGEIRMMGAKLIELKDVRFHDNLNLRKAFFGDILDRLENWKNDRNDLMHGMAEEGKTIIELDEMAISVAKNGRELIRECCSACQRFKKFNRQ